MNKKGKNSNTIITYLLLLFIIVCQIFRYKNIYIESNNVLEVSISNLLYPFTFLFIIWIKNKTNFKEAHNTIIKTSIIFLIFILLLSILNTIPSNFTSLDMDIALKKVFTTNYFTIGTKDFYYVDIINTLSFTLLYYFSHTIILILYEAMEPYTYKFIAYALSMFIPYALDTLCYVTINDSFKEIGFNNLITHLTSNFVIVITSTILVTLLFSIIEKVRSKS